MMNKKILAIFIVFLSAANGLVAKENVPGAKSMKQKMVTEKSIMEVLASTDEVAAFAAGRETPFFLFGEGRENSIRRLDAPPKHWIALPEKSLNRFAGEARPGEFYVFQIGLLAAIRDVGPLSIQFKDLSGLGGTISKEAIRCFNLGGIDENGDVFTKEIRVAGGRVQPLWIGVEIPATASGVYKGTIAVGAEGAGEQAFAVAINVGGDAVEKFGDLDSKKLSRLRWLDSTIGHDDDVVTAPYIPITRSNNSLSLLGKELTLGANGLPAQFNSFFNPGNTALTKTPKPFLARPFSFIVETTSGAMRLKNSSIQFTREQKGAVEWTATSENSQLSVTCNGLMEYEGFTSYKIYVKSKVPLDIKDIRLEMAVNDDEKLLFTGLGHEGCKLPEDIDWKWKSGTAQDSFWIGNVNSGFMMRLKGANYQSGLCNTYFEFQGINMPDAWANEGKGGINIERKDGQAGICIYSGPRTTKANEELLYQIEMHLTPFKVLDTDEHWGNRYYHPRQGKGQREELRDPALAKKLGANIINIHHNQEQNIAINYPYWDGSFEKLKKTVELAHEEDMKVKIYYTTREITTLLNELWAFNSLNGEIIFPGPGNDARPGTNKKGPHPWLQEHLRENYIPAWRETLKGKFEGMLDLAVVTTPDSRLENFYLEGLNYTLEQADIDGLYIDGISLSRKGFQRAQRLLQANDPESICDIHLWHGCWNKKAKNSALLVYFDKVPYVERIWPGEGYDYDVTAENWLVEISGIPFGVMSEMLRKGGHQWRGMLFGATCRLGWSKTTSPTPIWAVWDDVGMQGTEMLGWWDPRSPLKSDNKKIYATAYRKEGTTLISLASWSDKDESVKLSVDWEKLGLNPEKVKITQPAVDQFQPAADYRIDASIVVPANKGVLLVLTEES